MWEFSNLGDGMMDFEEKWSKIQGFSVSDMFDVSFFSFQWIEMCMCLSYIYTHTVSTVVYVNLYEVHVRTGLMQFLNTEIHVMLHVSFPMSSDLAWFGLYGPNDNPWPRSFQLIAKRDEVWHFACQDCVWIMRTCDDCDQDLSFLILWFTASVWGMFELILCQPLNHLKLIGVRIWDHTSGFWK